MVEVLKHRFNRGHRSNLSFFRDAQGLECDLLYENGNGMGAIEIKSGATIASDWFDALNRIAKALPRIAARAIVYGGVDRQSRRDGEVVPLAGLREMLERFRRTGESLMNVIRKALLYEMLKRLGLDAGPSARRPQDQRIILRKRPAWTAFAESL